MRLPPASRSIYSRCGWHVRAPAFRIPDRTRTCIRRAKICCLASWTTGISRTQTTPHRQCGGAGLLRRRRWSESNRRTQGCSLLPQPLGHSANERNNATPTRERVCFSARPPGLEPGLTESESVVLPELDDRRKTQRYTRARKPTRHVDNTNNSTHPPCVSTQHPQPPRCDARQRGARQRLA